MFDKVKQIGELKKMRDQAMIIQKQLAAESIEVNEEGIRIVVTGDQKIKELEINGAANQKLINTLNKALKKSQEMAAKKMQEMSGGLGGLLKGLGQ
ncbi:MAG: YbaB/EbfC family nucleoid-associated protein [Patescibacteria group bacterium]